MESIQKSLFEDPIGQRFRLAREKAGLSQEAVARQLRLPVVVIKALENEDWVRLGAPIYVRSYLGTYARFLGLPQDLADKVIGDAPVPALRPVGNSARARLMFDRGMLNLAYLVMTAVIVGSVVMLAMHFNSPAQVAQLLPLDPPNTAGEILVASTNPASMADQAQPLALADPTSSETSAVDNAGQVPVMASFAPSLPVANMPAEAQLLLRFRKESWVNISDAAGRPVERGLIALGSERRYGLGQVSSVVLGNAAAVEVSLAGRVIDLQPYQEANIARFTVSSAGQIAPIGD